MFSFPRTYRSSCLALLALAPVPAALAQGYTFVNLGELSSTTSLDPVDLNNLGQVSGFAYNTQSAMAFRWADGNLQALGTLGGPKSYAYFMNDAGDIVGEANLDNIHSHPFLWQNGVMQDLFAGRAASDSGTAWDINNAGSILITEGSGSFLLKNNTMTEIPHTTGTIAELSQLNDNDIVVGSLSNDADFTSIAFVWDETNGERTLGTFGGQSSAAFDINNAGVIVGRSQTADGHRHSFKYENGIMVDLNIGAIDSDADAINEQGDIVGSYSSASGGGGYLWHNGIVTDLQTLMPANTGFTIFNGYGINDRGQIMVSGMNANGFFGAGILTPVPEPASLCAFALGVLLFKRRVSGRKPERLA